MASVIEQATVALVTALQAIPSTTVERNRDIPVDFVTAEQACLVVTDGDDDDDSPRLQASLAEFDTQVVIAGYVTADDFADLGPARDALWVKVWNIVLANRVLGDQLTWDARPGKTSRRIDDVDTGKPVAVFEMPVTLRLKLKLSDPAIAA